MAVHQAKRVKPEAAGDGAGNMLDVCKMVRFTFGGHGATVLAHKSHSDGVPKWKGKRKGGLTSMICV